MKTGVCPESVPGATLKRNGTKWSGVCGCCRGPAHYMREWTSLTRPGLRIGMWALAAAVLLAAAPAWAAPKGGGPGVFIDARGLRKDSARVFSVYRGNTCVKVARAGQVAAVAPGTYDVRVGFPSGWVAAPVEVKPGKPTVVPTGLFQFRTLTPPKMRSTVPQKLYHGRSYLVTGYQGQTARLLPGKYTVRYHAPTDRRQARMLKGWHVVGPFRANYNTERSLKRVCGPEQALHDLGRTFTDRGKKLTWRKLAPATQRNLQPQVRGVGFVYLATEFQAEAASMVQLVGFARGGMKVWLNGKLIRTVPMGRRTYITVRTEIFAPLRKGTNRLLIKTMASQYAYWPFGVGLEHWRSYDVTVRAGQNALPPQPATVPHAAQPAPVGGIKGIVFCQVPNRSDGRSGLHYEQFRIVRRPSAARICTLIPAAPNGTFTDLTGKHFAAAMQPDLSYDGKKIIFTARRAKDTYGVWNIYEMNLDGSGLRQITRDMGECSDPYYLPNEKIVFSSDVTGFRDEYDRDKARLLYTCNPDGSDAERITFNLSSDTASIVLQDGRILFTTWQHHGEHSGVDGTFAFGTVMPDGTQFNAFTGNQGQQNDTKSYAQQLTDGRVVYVDSAGHRHYNAGGLRAVDLSNPQKNHTVLTPGMVYNGYNLAGRYASPYPLPNGRMLCSYSPGRGTSALRTDPWETIHMGVYRFDFDAGRPGAIVFDDPTAQDYDALAVFKRPVPPIVPDVVDRRKTTGVMMCVNAYISDRPQQTKYARIGLLPPAKPGEIKAVRVTEGFGIEDTDRNRHKATVIDMLQMSFGSNSNAGNGFEQKRILGYAPVESDGSFSVEVPADKVLSLQTLDANGMAIETQLTWVWVRPGETRLCIGCHEPRDSALSNTDCIAMRRPATVVAEPKVKPYTIDFRRDIMPIIEKRCSGCHNPKKTSGGLDLRKGFELVFHRAGHRGRKIEAAMFNHAYESLLQAPPNRVGTLVISNAARHSPLIWRLYGKQLAFTDVRNPYKKKCNLMPPGKPLPEAEKRLFVEWVDLGAQWDNILGEDPLPGYNAKESKRMAIEVNRTLARPILNAEEAFKARCLECHDTRKLAPLRTIRPEQIAPLMKRMMAKRRGWIKPQEVTLISGYIRKNAKAPAKRK